MADSKSSAQSIKDILAEQNKILKENLRIQSKSAGIDSNVLNDQQDISNVLQDQVKQLKFQVSEKNLLKKITSDINQIAEKGYSLGQEELGTQKGIGKLQKDRLALEQKIRLIKQQQNKFSQEALTGDVTSKKLNASIAMTLGEQADAASNLSLQMQTIEKSSERIGNSLGVKAYGALKDIVNVIPGLSKFSGPFNDAAEAARATVTQMESTNLGIDKYKKLRKEGVGTQEALELANITAGDVKIGSFKAQQMQTAGIAAGWDSIGKKLVSTATILVVFKELLELIKASDKAAGEFAKGMNMSYKDAQKLRGELRSVSQDSSSIFVNTESLSESLTAINKTLGTNVMLNKEDLETFTKLRKTAGFTNEELMGMQAISLATGTSLESNTGEFLAQAKISSLQNGVLLNEKELLKGIKDVSASTTLSLGKNPGLIAEAVATSKALGIELSKVDAIAGSLLDFESSISAELEAEMLLGKGINLEKARQAALNNDLATVAKEISEQAGTSAEFGAMNRIQQEALAKAVGMSRDDLAKTLFVQEQLSGATGEQAEKREKLLNNRIAEVGIEQAQKELADGSLKTLEEQASVSERMEATMSKIRDAFMSIADTVLIIIDPIVNILAPVLSGIASTVGYMVEGFKMMLPLLGPIAIYMNRIAIQSSLNAIMQGITLAFTSASTLGPLGIGIGLAAAAGFVGFVKSQTVEDGIAPSTKGPFTITDSYGAMATTTAGDSLMASPNIGKGSNESNKTGEKTNKLLEALIMQSAKKPELSPVGLYEIQ